MGLPAKQTMELRDFPGLMTNVDPHDLPPGSAQVQINVVSIVAGELQVRQGIKEVQFEDS